MDRYDIHESIGEGGFGKVYKVRRKTEQLILAMKIIKQRNEDEISVEGDVLQKLHHPHIVQFHDKFFENEQLHIVLEYCPGGSLEKQVKLQGEIPFTEGQILEWLTQISLALEFLHHSKHYHRDIKPSNILIARHGQCKLADFGLVKVVDTSSTKLMSNVEGTQPYMAPELWFPTVPLNDKADMWALGCVVHYMCCFDVPFKADHPIHLACLIQTQKPICISKDSYGEALQKIIDELLVKEYKYRISAIDLLKKILLRPFVKKWGKGEQGERIFAVINEEEQQSSTSQGSPSASASRFTYTTEMLVGRSKWKHQFTDSPLLCTEEGVFVVNWRKMEHYKWWISEWKRICIDRANQALWFNLLLPEGSSGRSIICRLWRHQENDCLMFTTKYHYKTAEIVAVKKIQVNIHISIQSKGDTSLIIFNDQVECLLEHSWNNWLMVENLNWEEFGTDVTPIVTLQLLTL